MNYKLQTHFLNDVSTWGAHILALIIMDIIKSPFLHQCRLHSNVYGFKIVQKSFIQSSSNLQEANHIGFSCQHGQHMWRYVTSGVDAYVKHHLLRKTKCNVVRKEGLDCGHNNNGFQRWRKRWEGGTKEKKGWERRNIGGGRTGCSNVIVVAMEKEEGKKERMKRRGKKGRKKRHNHNTYRHPKFVDNYRWIYIDKF